MPVTTPVDTLFAPQRPSRDLRVSRLLRRSGPAHAVLLGYPDDRGVVAGGGRPGASQGPAGLRRALLEYGTTWNLARVEDLEGLTLIDGGDVTVDDHSATTHEHIAEAVVAGLAMAELVIGIGGGHDCTYGGLLGMAQALGGPLGGVNIDAHLDVRSPEEVGLTSGTPFRRAIEDPRVRLAASRFSVIGADPRAGTRSCHAFLVEGGGEVITRRQLAGRGAAATLIEALDRAGPGPLFVSFDLDVMAAAHAPGVSVPSPDGLDPREALDLVFEVGADPRVRYFDLMELAPALDPIGLTARLAAALVVELLHGLVTRAREQ